MGAGAPEAVQYNVHWPTSALTTWTVPSQQTREKTNTVSCNLKRACLLEPKGIPTSSSKKSKSQIHETHDTTSASDTEVEGPETTLRIQSLETTIALCKSDALVATKAATTEMRRVEADHSAAMKRSQTKHDGAMKCLQTEHNAAMKCLQTDHNAAMKRLQAEHIAATKSAADRATKLTKERGAAEQRLAEIAESKASATALPLLAALRDQLAAAH